ncbi:SCO3374 family protein [Streptomyces sp. NRRL S-455]|uniref:SCO3374 family protein n=1 Tax=Streptomyces sp. NRRL S-455 TaxID=1463908 RepID=UPI0004C150EE|nr:SCO3374 family protein [Streptomyces sp. NRRL S-455]
MFGAPRSVTAAGSPVVPPPRRPLDTSGHGSGRLAASGQVRRWYECELGWPTVSGDPVRLVVGARFDVLDVPAEAGHAALRRLGPGAPVALRGDRMRFLVASGSAEELPGLLEWLEWGTLALDLRTIGAGGAMEAPVPPCGAGGLPSCGAGGQPSCGARGLPHCGASGLPHCGVGGSTSCGAGGPLPRAVEGPLLSGAGPCGGRALSPGRRHDSQGAAVWLRPPEPGCEVEASLPTLSALGGGAGAPDLVRLVDTVATHCHRVRLRRACAQPTPSRARGR